MFSDTAGTGRLSVATTHPGLPTASSCECQLQPRGKFPFGSWALCSTLICKEKTMDSFSQETLVILDGNDPQRKIDFFPRCSW